MSNRKSGKEQLDELLKETMMNIRSDRAITSTLLTDLVQEMKAQGGSITVIQQCGLIASKYVETLQRSNEQLVKLTALLHKKTSSASEELSNLDKEKIFDLLSESGTEEGEGG